MGGSASESRSSADIVAHIEESYGEGYGRVYKINREGGDERRDELLEGIPTRQGTDRDEMPSSGLRDQVRASVTYVPSTGNS